MMRFWRVDHVIVYVIILNGVNLDWICNLVLILDLLNELHLCSFLLLADSRTLLDC